MNKEILDKFHISLQSKFISDSGFALLHDDEQGCSHFIGHVNNVDHIVVQQDCHNLVDNDNVSYVSNEDVATLIDIHNDMRRHFMYLGEELRCKCTKTRTKLETVVGLPNLCDYCRKAIVDHKLLYVYDYNNALYVYDRIVKDANLFAVALGLRVNETAIYQSASELHVNDVAETWQGLRYKIIKVYYHA
jgi:hypothetical protein